jgi:integrase
VWTIPSERSKNGRENRVYLTDLALSLLPETEGYVFPASRGAHGPLYVNTLSHHLSHHVKPEYLGLPRWTPHDLRRTAATGLASLGCSDEIIDEVQNHKKRGIIRTYNRYRYDKEKQEWLVKWSEYLETLVKL